MHTPLSNPAPALPCTLLDDAHTVPVCALPRPRDRVLAAAAASDPDADTITVTLTDPVVAVLVFTLLLTSPDP